MLLLSPKVPGQPNLHNKQKRPVHIALADNYGPPSHNLSWLPDNSQSATHCCRWVIIDVIDPSMPLWWDDGGVVCGLICIDHPPLAVCKNTESNQMACMGKHCQCILPMYIMSPAHELDRARMHVGK
jgi:hypothetical protein